MHGVSPYKFPRPRFTHVFWIGNYQKMEWKGNERSSLPLVRPGKDAVKIWSKFTGEHPCQSVISVKLFYNFIKITLWHGYSPVNFLHIFRALFHKNTYGGLLLKWFWKMERGIRVKNRVAKTTMSRETKLGVQIWNVLTHTRVWHTLLSPLD